MSGSDRPLSLLIGLAALVLLANLAVLVWLHRTSVPELPRTPKYDLAPGEQPVRP